MQQKEGKPLLEPEKPVSKPKSDEVEIYLQKNLDLKSKVKILEKDVQLWKTNYDEFNKEIQTQR